MASGHDPARQGHGRERAIFRRPGRRPLSQAQDLIRDAERSAALSGVPAHLVCELLTQSLKAWTIPGGVEGDGEGVLVIGQNGKSIRIDPAHHPMFRWTVSVDSRKRGAV